MAERETVTENLRQMRDDVDRLYAEALARLRAAQAADCEYRAAALAAYPTEESNDVEET